MLSIGYNMSNALKRPEFKEKFVETSEDLFKVIRERTPPPFFLLDVGLLIKKLVS